MLTSLEQSILAALVYFDMFEYPLTLLEIQRYLLWLAPGGTGRPSPLSEISRSLNSAAALGKIVYFKKGFYYLRGRDANVRIRAERYGWAAAKYRRAQRVSRFLSYAPFVRLIAVCNSLSISAARRESDIDLFVVTKTGGVWWARLITLLVLQLLRLRPGQNGVANKICLSFFVDDERLDLAPWQAGERDVYLAYWLAALYPLYEAGDQYGRLWRANDWLRSFLPQARPVLAHPARRLIRPPLARPGLEWCLRLLTPGAAWLQWRLFPQPIRKLANRDSRVRIEPGILKFHTNDRRAEYNREFSKRFKVVSSGLL